MSTNGEPIPQNQTEIPAPAAQAAIPESNIADATRNAGLAESLTNAMADNGANVLDNLAKDSWGTPEPIGTTGAKPEEDTSEKTKYPDREALIKRLEERTEGFFAMAQTRTTRIEDATQGIQQTHRGLEEVKDDGPGIVRRVRDASTSQTSDEVINLVGQTARQIDEQIADAKSTIIKLDVDGQLTYIGDKESELTGGGMEKYKTALREALKIQDPELREIRLAELKEKLLVVSDRINEDAKRSRKTGLDFEDNTKQRSTGAPGRLESAEMILPRLQQELGNDFRSVLHGIGDMKEAYARFRGGLVHVESLPHEFSLLAQAASELGYGIKEVFAAFEKGQFR